MMTTTTTTEQALLRAILLKPEDDLPRVVYADWLDEHADTRCPRCLGSMIEPSFGERDCESCRGTGTTAWRRERAEWIRVQCELSRLPLDWRTLKRSQGETKESRMTRRADLIKRERELWRWSERGKRFLPQQFHDMNEFVEENVKWSRGFVSEVRLTLAAFMGGECMARGQWHGDLCSGGRIQAPNAQFTQMCPNCSGTGRVEGIARRLFECQPVERVVLTDREPHESVFDNQPAACRLMWILNDANLDTPSSLPWSLYSKLRIQSVRDGGHDWAGYPTRQAALDALSRACVRLGREWVGLGQSGLTTSVARSASADAE